MRPVLVQLNPKASVNLSQCDYFSHQPLSPTILIGKPAVKVLTEEEFPTEKPEKQQPEREEIGRSKGLFI